MSKPPYPPPAGTSPRNTDQPHCDEARITSYNVCYTKLLRVDLAACVINRAPTDVTEEVVSEIKRKVLPEAKLPVYAIPENEALGKPSIGDVKRWLDADVLYGHSGLQALVDNYVVAAMQIGNFLDRNNFV